MSSGIARSSEVTVGRECLPLKWSDIDLEEAVLNVQRQWSRLGELTEPKTEKGKRRVPLTIPMVALLRQLRTQALSRGQASPESFVFSSRTGTPLSHRNVQRRGFAPARDLAKLPQSITFHDLRHAFASIAAHRGVPVQVLSEVMGHSNVAITQTVYMHLYNREESEHAFRSAMSS